MKVLSEIFCVIKSEASKNHLIECCRKHGYIHKELWDPNFWLHNANFPFWMFMNFFFVMQIHNSAVKR